MKTTFTLLAAAVLMTSAAIAQKNGNHQSDNNYGNNSRDVVINDNHDRGRGYDDRGRGNRYSAEREKNMQIAQINRDYNNRIQSVRNKFFMNRYHKQRIINSLQFQREQEIRAVIAKFNRREYQYDKRDDRMNDHDRRNW